MKHLITLLLSFSCFLILTSTALNAAAHKGNCCPRVLDNYEKCNYAYIGMTGSIAFHNDLDLDFPSTPFKSQVDLDTGYGFGLSVGYAMPKYYLRAELEMLYRRNSFDCITTDATAYSLAAGSYGASGYTRDVAILGNLIFDVPITNCFGVYVGGGVGISFNEIEFNRVNNVTYPSFGISGYESQQDHDLFAWNAMAGLSYDVMEYLALTAGYRIFGTSTISFNDAAGFSRTNAPLYHSIDLGLRFKM